MSRLFAFGCSFTQYIWPTWADILACNFDYAENWGQSGAGNQFIANSLVECHLKNNITKHDTVGIMWTNVSRLDTYSKRQWHTHGNIYTQDFYDKATTNNLFDTRGYYIRDLASIYMVEKLLDQLQCQYYMFSMVDMTNPLQYEHNDCHSEISDVLPYYKDTIGKIRSSMHKIVFNYDWSSRPLLPEKGFNQVKKRYQDVSGPDWPEIEKLFDTATQHGLKKTVLQEIFDLDRWNWSKKLHQSRRIDNHPTPLEHLEYLIKVLPEHKISHQTQQLVSQIDKSIRADTPVDGALQAKITKTQSDPVERW